MSILSIAQLYFKKEKVDHKCSNINWPIVFTAKCLQVFEKTVFRVMKKLKTEEPFWEEDIWQRDMVITLEYIPYV